MPRTCSVCSSVRRTEIDLALIRGKESNRRIATQYGVSEATIRRHRHHILTRKAVHDVQGEASHPGNLSDLIMAGRCGDAVRKIVHVVQGDALKGGTDRKMVYVGEDQALKRAPKKPTPPQIRVKCDPPEVVQKIKARRRAEGHGNLWDRHFGRMSA